MREFADWLPRGNTLDDRAFRQRHRLLSWILALHIVPLFLFGIWQKFGIEHSALEVAPAVVLLVFGQIARNRRVKAFFVTAGLVFCSSVLVHFSGGTIEAHFHFFILIGLIALYQDWVPFTWNVVFVVLSHGWGSVIDADSMYNHFAAQNNPWTWAGIHGISVLAACIGVIIFWKNTEREQHRNVALQAELADAELATLQAEAARRKAVSDLLINLARRNQSLVDRQLNLIADLEQRKRVPAELSELFQLDHLATRMRRNAESLLVLSGDEPLRRWGHPVPLTEIVRAAAAEIEDYDRVEVLVNEDLEVASQAVTDLVHLLAELLENATAFSPPTSKVQVSSHPVATDGSTHMLCIEDSGIGMSDEDLAAANRLLAKPRDVDLERSSRLGFHVVGRLAMRSGLQVRLEHTSGGGLTALVSLPDRLVTQRSGASPRDVVADVEATSGPQATRSADATELVPTTLAHRVARRFASALPARDGQDILPLEFPPLPAADPTSLSATAPTPERGQVPEGGRSMLSRFQASQRAGRAVVEAGGAAVVPTSDPAAVDTDAAVVEAGAEEDES
jgi:signal transduction histidine kinase